jgi:xylulokinase
MPLYVGLDCSTQALTAFVLDTDLSPPSVVFEHEVVYDRDLPRYGTAHGVLPSEEADVRVSPPGMWAEALELALEAVAGSGVERARIAAMSGAAQQHGSVYLNGEAAGRLASLDPARPLAPQLSGIYARPVAPIWMDMSTRVECAEIAGALGGAAALAQLTGSRAFERFTGPQIRRFWREEPAAYAATARIHLVSSFLASLLVGAHAPLDPGDASGMNLMNLGTSRWSEAALEATAPELDDRLPDIVPSGTVVGPLASWWQRRHGLPPAAVVVWSGDNPCSLVGTGLVREGRLGVSLGTSDTVFGLMRRPRVDAGGTGHVFGAPTGDFMGLTCFLNGSLARERVRDEHGLDWAGFDEALGATPPGNGGALMLPWFEPEITPPVAAAVVGVRRLRLDPRDTPANVRAVVEAQMMAMANHSGWMDVEVEAIHATGGASANRAILQVMADVFGADVYRFERANAACLGAALCAWHADEAASAAPRPWDEIVEAAAWPEPASRIRPRAAHVETYRELRRRHADFEREALR